MAGEEDVCCIGTPYVYTSATKYRDARQFSVYLSGFFSLIILCISIGSLQLTFTPEKDGSTYTYDIYATILILGFSLILLIHAIYSNRRCDFYTAWLESTFVTAQDAERGEERLAVLRFVFFDLRRYHAWSVGLCLLLFFFLFVIASAESVPNHAAAVIVTGIILVFVLFNVMLASFLFKHVLSEISFMYKAPGSAEFALTSGKDGPIYTLTEIRSTVRLDVCFLTGFILKECSLIASVGYCLSKEG